MARVERDVCLRPRDLEKLRKVVLEFAGVLDEYLAGVNGGKQQAQHKQQPASKQSKQQSKPRAGKQRNKYTFNKAILAVLHSNGCMSESDLWNALAPRDGYEEKELEDAFRYLGEKGVIQFDMVQGCWFIKG
ncbi:MAG: hypothetical protein F7B59_08315 [Desulfurococcales archaeon]|nr:hypothetical protein [Desulfurococcales archaeon]